MAHYDGSYKNDTLDIQSSSTILSWTYLEVGQGLWKKDYGSCWEKKTKDVIRNMQKSVVSVNYAGRPMKLSFPGKLKFNKVQ